jgi:hypothetical protein
MQCAFALYDGQDDIAYQELLEPTIKARCLEEIGGSRTALRRLLLCSS